MTLTLHLQSHSVIRFLLRIMEGYPSPVSHKASKFASKDVISSMPENVIIDILDHLPIQDAVRTSILSRNWRFKWTLLTQLVFNRKFFDYNSPRTQGEKYYHGKIISRLLLNHKGALTKFHLEMPDSRILDDDDVSHWVLFLSQKGIKSFSLIIHGDIFDDTEEFRLPTHLLSCVELKHLKLRKCCFPPMPSFYGFPNLLGLDLCCVQFASCKDWEFIARCPLLETLEFSLLKSTDDGTLRLDELQLDEIAKLENLKTLSLSYRAFENMVMSSSGFIRFIGSFQTLQKLTINFYDCMFLEEDGDRKRVPIVLPCLKTLILERLDYTSDSEVSCVLEMICGSPNLQTLEIEVDSYGTLVTLPAICSSEVSWRTMGQLQLRNAVLEDIQASESKVCFIEFILASSPFLRMIKICNYSAFNYDYMLTLSNKLLKLQRAFPLVKIVLD